MSEGMKACIAVGYLFLCFVWCFWLGYGIGFNRGQVKEIRRAKELEKKAEEWTSFRKAIGL